MDEPAGTGRSPIRENADISKPSHRVEIESFTPADGFDPLGHFSFDMKPPIPRPVPAVVGLTLTLALTLLGGLVGSGARADASPRERADPNSRIAHTQLVEKARQGGIDLYFLGDSITRRWGTKDPQYRDFLANWRTNFFGWNAGNFGWGGDTVQNVLWRIREGELDGVHPKVIVVLAGTNNLGGADATERAEELVEDVTGGIRAILRTILEKAPGATVILTGVFPRNDGRRGTRLIPLIRTINQRLATMTDGKKVRFVDLSDRLADREGRLVDGTTVDGLHLSVTGYQIWADALKPHLIELLGPRSARDHAPPPTGDPGVRNGAQ